MIGAVSAETPREYGETMDYQLTIKEGGNMVKKRAKWIVIILIACFLIVLTVLFLVFTKRISLNALFISAHDTIGADLSNYQGDVDMKKIKEQNIKFVYIKATEGSTHMDKHFKENWENAGKAGMPKGAYHFFSFDSDGKKQAEHFIRTVKAFEGNLLPVVDVEYYGNKEAHPPEKKKVVKELKKFLDCLEEACHVKPMIYTTQKVYHKYIKEDFHAYPFWIRSVFYPPEFTVRGRWTLWQYSDSAELEGYSGDERHIDLNVLNADYSLKDLEVGNKEKAIGYGISSPRTDRAGVTTWDCVYFGNYWQNDTNGDGRADRRDEKEKIKWRVLSIDSDDAFLLADRSLDCHRYNTSYTDVTWETCTLRSWLNGYGASGNSYGIDYRSDNFINNAFSSAERNAIKKTTVINDDNPYYDTNGGNNTSDKIYLLSIAEASNTDYGFHEEYKADSKARESKNTAYAEAQGAYTNKNNKYAGNGWWWLRSSGFASFVILTSLAECRHGNK